MVVYGLDLGGSKLRLAPPSHGDGHVIQREMPRAVEAGPAVGSNGAGYQVRSLKRALDFDRSFPTPNGERASLDLLAELITSVYGGSETQRSTLSSRFAIAVPPSYSQRKRACLQAVAEKAGLTDSTFVDDALAALLASRDQVRGFKCVLVYSWGATSFSASLFQQQAGALKLVAQECTGDVGGDDLSGFLLDHIAAETDPSTASDWPDRIIKQLESGKPSLADGIPITITGAANGGRLVDLRPETFSGAVRSLFAKTVGGLKQVMAGHTVPEAVLLVGGMTTIPQVRDELQELLRLPMCDAPEDAVARGAALYGGIVPRQLVTPKEDKPPVAPAAAQSPAPRPPRSSKWGDKFLPLIQQAQRRYLGRSDQKTPRSAPVTPPRAVGRNAPCPCGSGRKYKKCCGR